MSEVQRYTPIRGMFDCALGGDYVSYSDYAALTAKYEAERAAREAAELGQDSSHGRVSDAYLAWLVASDWLTMHREFVNADNIERFQYQPEVEDFAERMRRRAALASAQGEPVAWIPAAMLDPKRREDFFTASRFQVAPDSVPLYAASGGVTANLHDNNGIVTVQKESYDAAIEGAPR